MPTENGVSWMTKNSFVYHFFFYFIIYRQACLYKQYFLLFIFKLKFILVFLKLIISILIFSFFIQWLLVANYKYWIQFVFIF